MEEKEILVYLFTGFLESGKTSLIQGTLEDPNFCTGERTLLICCEDGEVEYDESILKKTNTVLVQLDEIEQLTEEQLEEWQKEYQPKRVMIEYNGTWDMETLKELDMPEYWIVVQILTTIDASTFEVYMGNMGAMLVQQFTDSDAVIFNRCNEETPKASFRRRIKAINRKAQIIYELEDGTIDNTFDEEMPFDTDADVIEISEEDYGIWYMDAMDHPKKYKGKTLHFKAVVYHPERAPKDWFVPGRFAMTCCADDIAFIGFKCQSEEVSQFQNRDWIYVTAEAKVEFAKEYRGRGLVLYASKIEKAEPSKEELVYFT